MWEDCSEGRNPALAASLVNRPRDRRRAGNSRLELRETQSCTALFQQFLIESYSLIEQAEVDRPQVCNLLEPCSSFEDRDGTRDRMTRTLRRAPRSLFIYEDHFGAQ